MPHYANVIDLTELDGVALLIVGSWFDKNPRDLEPDRIDGHYVPIRGDDGADGEQSEARADILSEKFGVRVKHRATA